MPTDEIDWDRVSRQNYAGDVTSPRAWIQAANELLASAAVLEPHVLAWWQSMRAWSRGEIKISREHGFHAIYLMLCAFAVEDLCKSALVSSLTAEEREQLRERGQLPRRFKSHALTDLVALIGLAIDLQEEDLLRRMERAAVWHGRYPVPQFHRKKHTEEFSDGLTYSVSWHGSTDIACAKELVLKLRQHVNAPETYRVLD